MRRIRSHRGLLAVVLGAAASLVLVVPAPSGHPVGAGHQLSVVVRGRDGGEPAVLRAVVAIGGMVTRPLPIIDGAAAQVPADRLNDLLGSFGVLSVTPDLSGHVMGIDPRLGYDPGADTGSLDQVTKIVGARQMWAAGYTGKGVDVAVLDTGVTPVPGLDSNVINGPDLSLASRDAAHRYLDEFGHGTHMASIIAGRDPVSSRSQYGTNGRYAGIAPDARIVNVRVGAADGTADVSQVIAAIGWVTQHAYDPGLNIRVLNLSYGTNSSQSYTVDPLAYAVEAAWRQGIAVVVAGGNDGTKDVNLAMPAADPNVIAVGAEDPNGTGGTGDDLVPSFSDRGTAIRHVDVVAPGVHVLGLKAPGSLVAIQNPAGAVGSRFLRGTGTSQATAVVSGAAALLLQARPWLTPDQLKWSLATSARQVNKGNPLNSGNGLVQAADASNAAARAPGTPAANQHQGSYGTGTGLLEATRGGSHVTNAVGSLTGERDIFGRPWQGTSWAPTALAGSWQGGSWNGSTWTGTGWTSVPQVPVPSTAGIGKLAAVPPDGGTEQSAAGNRGNWTAANWAQSSWNGSGWDDPDWLGQAWVAQDWTGRTWVGRTWVAAAWADQSWS